MKPLDNEVHFITHIVTACIVLHNICQRMKKRFNCKDQLLETIIGQE